MSRNALAVEVAAAVLVAAVVLIAAPGVAVAAMLALLVLVVCGASLLVDRARGRRPSRRARMSRPRAPRR
jgi:hypothetical protein